MPPVKDTVTCLLNTKALPVTRMFWIGSADDLEESPFCCDHSYTWFDSGRDVYQQF